MFKVRLVWARVGRDQVGELHCGGGEDVSQFPSPPLPHIGGGGRLLKSTVQDRGSRRKVGVPWVPNIQI